MRTLPYRLCDVFTDRPFAGNALAVFTAADELDTASMRLLAREMNLSESAFVLRPTAPGADALLRIFTPTMELPFAGHPTLGTAFVLAEATLAKGSPQSGPVLRLQTARGIVQVQFSAQPTGPHFAWMTQPLPGVFAPGEGIAEDPATGAAAGPVLHARVFGSAERLERVEVGGQAVLMGRGEITLP